MKTVFVIATMFFALASTSLISMGMGYPLDMFSEHVTPKRLTMRTRPNKGSKHSIDAQKAAGSQPARAINVQRTTPCKSKSIAKKNKPGQRAVT